MVKMSGTVIVSTRFLNVACYGKKKCGNGCEVQLSVSRYQCICEFM